MPLPISSKSLPIGSARRMSFMPNSTPASTDEDARRSSARPWPGCYGTSSVITTTSPNGCEGDPGQPPPPAQREGPQPGLAASQQRRSAVDAGQVGVPMVRRVGPGVSLRRAVAGRSRIRQAAAHPAGREWYMHPNGQLPAYEWAFGDVNPPVHACRGLARLPARTAATPARATSTSWSGSFTS